MCPLKIAVPKFSKFKTDTYNLNRIFEKYLQTSFLTLSKLDQINSLLFPLISDQTYVF